MEIDVPIPSVVQTPNSALDIVDEMSERECRKLNVVVYNFSEGADRKADIKAFQTLSMDVFKLDLGIVKAVRLGPKIANKHRPLLLTVNELDDKNYLISHSYFLRRHEQFNKVFIAPDRTKLEHLRHKKVVEELKQRRAKGETGLLIRNGMVIMRQSRLSAPTSFSTDQSSHPSAPTSSSTDQSSSSVPTNHNADQSS